MLPYSPTSNLPWMPPRVPSQTSCSLLETTPKTKQWKIPQTYCCWTISCRRSNPPITTPSKKKSLLPCNAHYLGKLLCARTQRETGSSDPNIFFSKCLPRPLVWGSAVPTPLMKKRKQKRTAQEKRQCVLKNDEKRNHLHQRLLLFSPPYERTYSRKEKPEVQPGRESATRNLLQPPLLLSAACCICLIWHF